MIETADHGPLLCLGGVLTSAPPICGDVPVVGLDWATVTGEFTSGDVTWIENALVTGTYDGTAVTLTEPPRVATPEEFRGRLPSNGPLPCPEPVGGWAADGARFPAGSFYNDYISKLSPLASSQADWGGMWLAFIADPSTFDIDTHPENVIPVVLFTGNLARHEAELRAVWPGALCVATSVKTSKELEALASQVSVDEQGPDSLDPLLRGGGQVDYSRGMIRVDVVAVDESLQAAFDERYGAGVIELYGALQPVTDP